ncbi:MAG: dNTP triphosphohydrolase [Chloroflexota bacterium]|nr:dNTP triphosphohydrolase [Chloroflexota bacterium]
MSGVTQVVTPSEKRAFHTRLTHTIEVAQVARRLAEAVTKDKGGAKLAEELGGVDPDVAEAAALAHDLGHPPFGHIAEKELNKLVSAERDWDGFEGNAQSFRIVTKLALRHTSIEGLNLTRATLNAILKYPWTRKPSGFGSVKWGAYTSEGEDLRFAREGYRDGDETKSIEAELMDWADDIAYAVHDVEDFYRGHVIPLDRVVSDRKERDRFLEAALRILRNKTPYADEDLIRAFNELIEDAPITHPYQGTRFQRANLRSFTAGLIGRYVKGTRLRQPTHDNRRPLDIDPINLDMEVRMLKALTGHYVIGNPALKALQYGQRKVIHELYDTLNMAADSDDPDDFEIFPLAYQEELAEATDKRSRRRVVVDLIASLNDQQAFAFHQRLMGLAPGSEMDIIEP